MTTIGPGPETDQARAAELRPTPSPTLRAQPPFRSKVILHPKPLAVGKRLGAAERAETPRP